MQGNQLMEPQGRLMLAAAVFAVLALGVLTLVWFWPMLFQSKEASIGTNRILTTEEKLDVLEQVKQSSAGEPQIAEEEKEEVLEDLAASNDTSVPENNLSEKEKLNVLDSLNTP